MRENARNYRDFSGGTFDLPESHRGHLAFQTRSSSSNRAVSEIAKGMFEAVVPEQDAVSQWDLLDSSQHQRDYLLKMSSK